MNESKTFAQGFGERIKECILSKSYGCYISLAACVLTLLQIFIYPFVQTQLFSANVIVFSVLAVVFFVGLSLYRRTSFLGALLLMIFDFLSLIAFAGAEGIVDVFSTLFFDGFSIGKIFTLPFAEWFCVLSFVLTFILSSVALYLPQNKKEKERAEKPEIVQEETVENDIEKV